jgi:flagellar biosynthesis component FlhA
MNIKPNDKNEDDGWGKIFLLLYIIIFSLSMIYGTGLKDSFFGALVWSGILTWYIEKKSNEKKQRLNEEKQREKEEADAKISKEKLNALRDADVQGEAYTYQIGRHANETLALRYGLANAKGNKELPNIKLRKIRKLQDAKYEVELTSFGARRAIAIIEPGTEYVKTFYPVEIDWFERNNKLESLLKNNKGLSLADIAKFHIENALKE